MCFQNEGNDSNSPLARVSPSPNDSQKNCNNINTQISTESQCKRVSRIQKGIIIPIFLIFFNFKVNTNYNAKKLEKI